MQALCFTLWPLHWDKLTIRGEKLKASLMFNLRNSEIKLNLSKTRTNYQSQDDESDYSEYAPSFSNVSEFKSAAISYIPGYVTQMLQKKTHLLCLSGGSWFKETQM